MARWITPQEALSRDSGFFRRRGESSWKVDAKNRRIYSRFGFAEVRVQIKPDGTPDFDRVVYSEAPNINAVVWGIDADGIHRIAVVVQARPFADKPHAPIPSSPPIIFGQPCVMGFLEKIVGEKIAKIFDENAAEGAGREALEEAGAVSIISIRNMQPHNPNPTFCASWSKLFDIQVDLDKVSDRVDREELIYKAEYLPIKEVLRMIGTGWHNNVNYRNATANDAFFVWLCRHPEALAQAVS